MLSHSRARVCEGRLQEAHGCRGCQTRPQVICFPIRAFHSGFRNFEGKASKAPSTRIWEKPLHHASKIPILSPNTFSGGFDQISMIRQAEDLKLQAVMYADRSSSTSPKSFWLLPRLPTSTASKRCSPVQALQLKLRYISSTRAYHINSCHCCIPKSCIDL